MTIQRLERGRVALVLFVIAALWIILAEGAVRWPGAGLFALPATAVLTTAILGRRSAVLRVLDEEPERIVWYYLIHRHRFGKHVGTTLMLGLTDGTKLEHDLPLAVESDALAVVRARAPYASDGFSHAVERAFNRDPESTRKGA